jgi:hypothetical protein
MFLENISNDLQLSWMTAHHPAANGLVERFHRTLKAAIMCHADQQWTEAIPLVLLGIRMAFKEDLQASVAELVYGKLLTPTAKPVDPAHLITELCQHVARLRPVPAARHASPAAFVNSDLEKFTNIFVRTQRAGLSSPSKAAPTRSCHGERRCCNSSCVESPSLCQATG